MLLILVACITTVIGVPPPCVLDTPVVDVTGAAEGDTVRLTTHPLSEAFDTAVLVGSQRAEVLGVSRDGCDECDTCRADLECAVCDDCDDCAVACTTCVEQVRIEVPAVGDGTWGVTVTNRYGASAPGTIVVGVSDTGS